MQNDHTLIQSIYDAALNPESYPKVLQQLADGAGAYGAMVFDCTTRPEGRRVGLQHLSDVYEPEAVFEYTAANNADEVADQDRFADLSSADDEINLIHDAKLYTNSYTRGANVEAMLRRGVGGRYGALLSKENWNSDRFAFQILKGAELPSQERLNWAEGMLGHLAKSLSMSRIISGQRSTAEAMTQFLDKMPIGLGIVSPSGQLLFANTEFKRIAEKEPGLSITVAGKLTFRECNELSTIRELLASDTAHGRFGARPRREAVFIPDDEADAGLFIEICPLSSHPELDQFGAGTRLLSVFDGTQRRDVNPEIVAQFFPLSKSETQVLGLVSAGHSNVEIADIRGRSIETVNSQLKSLLRKTSSRNRTELVKVALSLSMFNDAA